MNETKTKIAPAAIMRGVCSVLCVLVGIAYVAAAYHMFLTGGDTPYTRERVSEYLLYLAIPSLILIGSVIAAFLLTRREGKREKIWAYTDPCYVLMRVKKKNPTHTLGSTVRAISREQHRHRVAYVVIFSAISVMSLAAALVLALDASQYKNEQLTQEIIDATLIVLPLSAVALASITMCSYLCMESARVELCAHSNAISEGVCEDFPAPKDSLLTKIKGFTLKNERILAIIARIAVGVAAIALVVFGAISGGMTDVLAKAVKICTECIGLG